MSKRYKMIFIIFDLDDTITLSRQKISKEMKKALKSFKYPYAIISGADRSQMKYQLDGLKCLTMAQSGNDMSPLWRNELSPKEKEEILKHIKSTKIKIEHDMLEDRGCQIALSMVGHHAKIELKRAYDPDQKKRKAILKKHPFKSRTLTVRIAGTTCFDYTKKKGTKGKNIERFLKEMGIPKEDCLYVGDALFKGGNDESVIGVVDTRSVKNPDETLKLIKNLS